MKKFDSTSEGGRGAFSRHPWVVRSERATYTLKMGKARQQQKFLLPPTIFSKSENCCSGLPESWPIRGKIGTRNSQDLELQFCPLWWCRLTVPLWQNWSNPNGKHSLASGLRHRFGTCAFGAYTSLLPEPPCLWLWLSASRRWALSPIDPHIAHADAVSRPPSRRARRSQPPSRPARASVSRRRAPHQSSPLARPTRTPRC